MTAITVLTALHGVAAKTITHEGKSLRSYDLNEHGSGSFTFEQREVGNFADLSNLIAGVEQVRNQVLIRGTPTAAAHALQAAGHPVWRRKNARADSPPTFAAMAHDWFMIDVDKLPTPAGVCSTSGEALAYVVSRLPPEFHDTRLRFQFSGSAHPTKPEIRVHLFGLFDRPIDDKLLRETFAAWNERQGAKVVDPALFDPVQLHYVAAPIVEGGPDPLAGCRSGIIPGGNELVPLLLRTRSGSRSRTGYRVETHHQEQDVDGLITGGREGYLLRLRIEVLRETKPETEDEFAASVWERFSAAVKLAPTPGVSDTHWTFDKVAAKCRTDWAKRDQLVGRKPIEGIEPFYPANPIPLVEAEAFARQYIAGYFARPRDMVLKLPAGLGKTRIVVEALAALPTNTVAYYYAPTHALLREVRDKILAQNPNAAVVLVQGRNPDTCQRHDLVNKVAATGAPVARVLCGDAETVNDKLAMLHQSRCPFRDGCPYWAQFTAGSQIYLFTTTQLKLPRQSGLPDPDFVVVDESFYGTFVEHEGFEQADLERLRWMDTHTARVIGQAIYDAMIEEKPLLGTLRAAWRAEVENTLQGLPVTGEARRSALAPFFEVLSARVGELGNAELEPVLLRQLPRLMLGMATSVHREWASKFWGVVNPGAGDGQLRGMIERLPARPRVYRLLTELAAELEEAPEREVSLAVVPGEVRWAPDRKRLHGPVLFLDASADKLISRVFKPDAEFHQIDVERNTGTVTQIYDHRMPRSGLREEGLVTRVQGVLDWCLPKYEKPAVFMYKFNRDQGTFTLSEDAEEGHLGHVRGLNRWEDCDAAFVIGGYLPLIEVVERTAAVLARVGGIDVTLAGEWGETIRGVRLRDGTGRGIANRCLADPLADAVLRQEQGEELVQAVDRIRSVRAERPKDIYVLSSIVIDLTVDRLVTLDALAGTKFEKLITRFGGLTALSAEWLVERAPDLFSSGKAVKNWKQRDLVEEKRSQTAIDTYSGLRPLIEGTYRIEGQRGHASPFIAEPGHPMTRSVLEFLVGTLAGYVGPEDQPMELPLVRIPDPIITDVFRIGERTLARQEAPLPKLHHWPHGFILTGGMKE